MTLPTYEGQTYLQAQADEFMAWISPLTDNGNNTQLDTEVWFKQFSREKHYGISERHAIFQKVQEIIRIQNLDSDFDPLVSESIFAGVSS